MGKLKSSVSQLVGLAPSLAAGQDGHIKKLRHLAEQAKIWAANSGLGLDPLFVLLNDWLRKRKIAYQAAEAGLVGAYKDNVVDRHLKTIQATFKSAESLLRQFDQLAAATDFERELSRLETHLKDVEAHIERKKSKLRQDPKFHDKIFRYERNVDDCLDKLRKGRDAMKNLRGQRPPPIQRVRELILITEASTLKALGLAMLKKRDEVNPAFIKMQDHLKSLARKLRERLDFSRELRDLQALISDADEMEKAAGG